MARKSAREAAIDAAMLKLHGKQGPDPDIDVDAVRAILGEVFDKGKAARS